MVSWDEIILIMGSSAERHLLARHYDDLFCRIYILPGIIPLACAELSGAEVVRLEVSAAPCRDVLPLTYAHVSYDLHLFYSVVHFCSTLSRDF